MKTIKNEIYDLQLFSIFSTYFCGVWTSPYLFEIVFIIWKEEFHDFIPILIEFNDSFSHILRS